MLSSSASNYPEHEVIRMPALSPTMTEGVIAAWKAEVGKEIAAGDIYAEIETDKATVDFEATDDAFVAKIFVEAGTNVKCGEPIALVVEDESDLSAFENFSLSSIVDGESNVEEEQQEIAASKHENTTISPSSASSDVDTTAAIGSLPDHIVLPMPALSPTMEEGIVAKWLKSEGEEIVAGDIIAEIDTDKATVDYEATDDGFLAKRLVEEGAPLEVGSPIAVVVEEAGDMSAFVAYVPNFGSDDAFTDSATDTPSTSNVPVEQTVETKRPEVVVIDHAPAAAPFDLDADDLGSWHDDVLRSPLGAKALAAQAKYLEEFGETGMLFQGEGN